MDEKDRQELLYRTEQALLPLERRDCVVCRGTKHTLVEDTGEIVECTRCAGSGSEAVARIQKINGFGAAYGMNPSKLLEQLRGSGVSDEQINAATETWRKTFDTDKALACPVCGGQKKVTRAKPPVRGGGTEVVECPACHGQGTNTAAVETVIKTRPTQSLHPSVRADKPLQTFAERQAAYTGKRTPDEVKRFYEEIRRRKGSR